MEWPISWEDVKKELETLSNRTVSEDVLGMVPVQLLGEAMTSDNHKASKIYDSITGLGETPKTYTDDELMAIFEKADKVRIVFSDSNTCEFTISNKGYNRGKLVQVGFDFTNQVDNVDLAGNFLIDITSAGDGIRMTISLKILGM